jgi:hypothetical protein
MIRPKSFATLIVTLGILLTSIGATAQARFKIKQLMGTGDHAPVPSELSFISPFMLNNNGQVAFLADGGLFFGSAGVTTLVAGFGDPAPGGGRFIRVTAAAMDSQANIVFRGQATLPSTSGLFLSSAGAITSLVADGTTAASGDVVFPNTPAVNDNGQVVFLSLSGNGLFLYSNGTITRLVARGNPAPGGSTFTAFSAPSINNSGQVVFGATLATGRQGLFLVSGGTVTKVVVAGDVLAHGGVFFAVQGSASINDAGAVAFSGTSNGSISDSGLFLFSGGALNVVVPAFTPIASIGGVSLLPQSASLNNAGQIAFISQRIPQTGFGISVFAFSGGTVTQVMAPGQNSPDADVFSGAFSAQINASGQVGFLSRMIRQNDALYLSSGSELTRMAGQGDSVAREPKFLSPFAFGFSNQDQVLVFDSTFPGGNGLFTASSRHRDHGVFLDAHVGQSIGSDGVIQGLFENFAMNGQGNVVMNVNLSSGISSLLLQSESGLTELVKASLTGNGDPAPGGGTFLGLRWSSINNLGQVAFTGFDTFNSGLYLASNGQITLAIPSSAPLPEGNGIFGTISLNAINDLGDIAFLGQSFPAPNGIFLLSKGVFTSVARAGAPAPGGGAYRLSIPDPRFGPVISNNGDVAFASDLSTGSRGLYLFSGGTTIRIAGPGDLSPDGSPFISADAPTINSSGQVAFTGVTAAKGSGAFLYAGGSIVPVAVRGDLVHKVTLTTVDRPQINDLGEVAFGANLSGGLVGVFIAKPKSDDPGDVEIESGPTLPVPEGFTELMRADHPRNFTFEERPDDSTHAPLAPAEVEDIFPHL